MCLKKRWSFKKGFYIKSDKGFSVSDKDHYHIIYQEEPLKLTIFCEYMACGDVLLALDSSPIKYWDPPQDNIVISESKKKEILNNIIDAYNFRGYKIDVCDY